MNLNPVARYMQSLPSPKDWPEDWQHENGKYYNGCVICNDTFIGHKRRVICKQCATIDSRCHET